MENYCYSGLDMLEKQAGLSLIVEWCYLTTEW